MEQIVNIAKDAMKTTRWADTVVTLFLFLGNAGFMIAGVLAFIDGNITTVAICLAVAVPFTILCIITLMLIHIVRLKAIELVKR